jgi:ribosomal protein L37AE/L43A
MPAGEAKSKRDATLEAIVEGKKMEAYVEHRTKDMHVCALCGAVGYKRKPMKPIGEKWVCLDCARGLKQVLDSLDQWEAEIRLEDEMRGKINESMRM